jgi:DMSO/TMAO reductase YedYZ molybdopterin-dependent catalytic subunit
MEHENQSPQSQQSPQSPGRRDLLVAGAAAGASALLAACGWRAAPLDKPAALFSGLNDRVSGLLLSQRPSREYPVAQRTPGSRFPSYYVSDGTPMLMTPATWQLQVGGMVAEPGVYSIEQIMAMPRVSYTVKHHCVEGWTAIASWAGVPFRAIAERVRPRAAARYVNFRSFDSGYSNGWDIASAMHPQTILAYAFNDRPIMPDHGAPLRLYSPIKLGYKLTKYLVSIEFTDQRPGGYWEDQGYPWFGGL